jgi:hypothetical protein
MRPAATSIAVQPMPASVTSRRRRPQPSSRCDAVRTLRFDILLLLPLAIVIVAHLAVAAGSLERGGAAFLAIVTEARYRDSLLTTPGLSLVTTAITLGLGTVAAQTLAHRVFPGRSLLVAMLTFPLAFPGVVVGFLIILLGGRLGLVAGLTRAFAGTDVGLVLGYVSFSVPQVLLTMRAAAEKLDPALVETCRWRPGRSWCCLDLRPDAPSQFMRESLPSWCTGSTASRSSATPRWSSRRPAVPPRSARRVSGTFRSDRRPESALRRSGRRFGAQERVATEAGSRARRQRNRAGL